MLAEKYILRKKDAEARAIILGASKRVAAVTAISPRALIDVLYALIESIRLIRKLATLYGGRPTGLGMVRLFRTVAGHLAITGGVALTDSVVQQLIGHGLAARLSARLGEGVVNGLLVARIGLAALDVCRPLPYLAGKPPAHWRHPLGARRSSPVASPMTLRPAANDVRAILLRA
jgi:putative membrane protein